MTRPFLLPNTPKMLLVALFGVSGLVGAPMLARAQAPAAGTPSDQQYRCLPNTTRCAYYKCDPTCVRTSAWETRDYSRGVDGDAPTPAYADNATGGYDRRYDTPPSQGYAPPATPAPANGPASGYDQTYQARNGDQATPGGYGAGGYAANGDDSQVGASAPTAPGAGYGAGGYGGGGYSGNNYANAYGYSQDSNGQPSYGRGYDQQTYGQETYENAPGRDDGDQDGYAQQGYGQDGYGQNAYRQPPVNPRADDQDDDDRGQDYAASRTPQQPSYRYSGQAQYRCVDDGNRCAYFRCDPNGDDCHRISGWSSRADADRRPDADGW